MRSTVSSPPRAEPRAGARQRVIAAILHLLDRRDLAHVTVDVILRSAGISRAGFYRHFADKDAALAAAVEEAFGRIGRAPDGLAGPIGSIADEQAKVAVWIGSVLDASVRSAGIQRAIAASPSLAAVRARQSVLGHAAVLTALRSYVERLTAAGIVRDADPDVLAAGISLAISGIFKRVVVDGAVEREADLLAGTRALVDRALFGGIVRFAPPGGRRGRLVAADRPRTPVA